VQRDYMLSLTLAKLTSGAPVPFGFSVLGDGVFYWLARSLVISAVRKIVETRLSRFFDVRKADEARSLFSTCVAMCRQAYAQQHTYTLMSMLPDVTDERFLFGEIIDCNPSSVLFRFTDRRSNIGGARICKLPRNRLNKRFDNERQVWQTHRMRLASDGFVQFVAADFFGVDVDLALVFEDDGGTALEYLCRCTKAAQHELARVVHRGVTRALDWLHDGALAFVDLHPGNVIVYVDGDGKMHAKLIDCESVCACGSSLTEVPVRPRFASLHNKTAGKQSDLESFVYLLAWIVDEFCPTLREVEAHQKAFDLRKGEICAKWPTAEALITSLS